MTKLPLKEFPESGDLAEKKLRPFPEPMLGCGQHGSGEACQRA